MTVNELYQTLDLQNRPPEDMAFIKRAYEYAERAHHGQKRKSGEPYIVHPLATACRLAQMKLDAQTVAAALLHDVCEDTKYSIADIRKEFGDTVAFLVEGVTKLDKLRYRGTERSAESLRKMFLAIAEDIRIVLIKLVDRLHNMETLQYLPQEKQKRIALETLDIFAPLAHRLGIGELKGQLEDLAFTYVHPREYEWLMKTLSDHFGKRKEYVERLKPVIAQELTSEHIRFFDIHARAKHHYSLYKKLLKYDLDINKVYDVLALRIIVESVEGCYATLGVIHKLWRPVPGLVKDYIALPKPNGYRSLHTTVFGPEGRTLEVQIRTQDMHDEAENGIAAHWAYTERKGTPAYVKRIPSFADKRELAWIQQLREWQKDFDKDHPEEFLEALKIDFFKNRIFVLTPKGDVIDLPEGATPVDFAYAVHTGIGHTTVGARVNGKLVSLDYQLKNREVVEILTQKNKRPSQDWLKFVKGPSARKKIGAYLRKSHETTLFERHKGDMTVEFSITARDRVGLARDMANIFARLKINIRSMTTGEKHRIHAAVTIQASIKNRTDLEKIMVRLKEVKGVEELTYKLLS